MDTPASGLRIFWNLERPIDKVYNVPKNVRAMFFGALFAWNRKIAKFAIEKWNKMWYNNRKAAIIHLIAIFPPGFAGQEKYGYIIPFRYASWYNIKKALI